MGGPACNPSQLCDLPKTGLEKGPWWRRQVITILVWRGTSQRRQHGDHIKYAVKGVCQSTLLWKIRALSLSVAPEPVIACFCHIPRNFVGVLNLRRKECTPRCTYPLGLEWCCKAIRIQPGLQKHEKISLDETCSLQLNPYPEVL